jgi:hypothetical protein
MYIGSYTNDCYGTLLVVLYAEFAQIPHSVRLPCNTLTANSESSKYLVYSPTDVIRLSQNVHRLYIV